MILDNTRSVTREDLSYLCLPFFCLREKSTSNEHSPPISIICSFVYLFYESSSIVTIFLLSSLINCLVHLSHSILDFRSKSTPSQKVRLFNRLILRVCRVSATPLYTGSLYCLFLPHPSRSSSSQNTSTSSPLPLDLTECIKIVTHLYEYDQGILRNLCRFITSFLKKK